MGFRSYTWPVGVFLALAAAPLSAQAVPDSSAADTTVVAGAGYGLYGPLAWLQKWIFGSRHRKLWATPVEVERLDLSSVGGGLTPIGADTGRRIGYLYFKARDGSYYSFREMTPSLSYLLPKNLKTDFGSGLVQDLQSGRHPGAPFVVPALANAVGAGPLPEARLVMLPQDSALASFGQGFSGALGFLRPGIDTRFRRVAGGRDADIPTADLLKLLDSREPPAVDTAAYLRERLFDIYLGSWDPLPQEWLWTRDAGGVWHPLPRTRDLAFLRLDGMVAGLAGQQVPQFASFSGDYDSRLAVTSHERILDRHLLMQVERFRYLEVAKAIQQSLPDSTIEAAVSQMPRPYFEAAGKDLIHKLEQRREKLPQAADQYYRMVVSRGEVYGTPGPDTVTAIRTSDGGLEIQSGERFDRRFNPKETKEVQLYLLEGEDLVHISGADRGGTQLTIGAGPGDAVTDSAGGGHVTVRDTAGVTITTIGKVKRDDEPLPVPLFVDTVPHEPPPIRATRYGISPWLDLNSDLGLFIGGGPVRTQYDYGYDPFKSRVRVRAAYATAPNDFAFDFLGEFHRQNSSTYLLVEAEMSAVEVLKFFGYGNESVRDSTDDFYNTGQWLFSAYPSVVFPIARKSNVRIGPSLKYISTDLNANTFIAQTNPYGTDGFGQIGVEGSVIHDARDNWRFATRGVLVSAGASFYPGIWSADEAFGKFEASAATYFTPVPSFTVAVRGSGKYVWGKYPVHEAAFIGGSRTVRGFSKQRFAGDAAAYGNLDAKLRLGTIPFVMRWDMGIQGIADVGRVFLEGETSDVWHQGYGGGLWAALPDRSFMGLFTITRSDERTTFWGGVGFIF